ncbi:hypothetical protein EIN_344250 [Entamoeba invadens IP1]|uniref:Uncharacterized protein n=1 Tax=Entamoeba invadens IP1 TaxID=370355 RepID=A0A0A1U6K7_ENTIV|nr:hypothetical protein EIN_344250 [Entamoeba invadens IP1]ELP88495.1 hypothetical protein EIN_344250 [Entamoeba invadens IP1]|eukprot:XP_004255266.1 hypothetical protein EIN_344250 [Entamoeba invadens IP1]
MKLLVCLLVFAVGALSYEIEYIFKDNKLCNKWHIYSTNSECEFVEINETIFYNGRILDRISFVNEEEVNTTVYLSLQFYVYYQADDNNTRLFKVELNETSVDAKEVTVANFTATPNSVQAVVVPITKNTTQLVSLYVIEANGIKDETVYLKDLKFADTLEFIETLNVGSSVEGSDQVVFKPVELTCKSGSEHLVMLLVVMMLFAFIF